MRAFSLTHFCGIERIQPGHSRRYVIPSLSFALRATATYFCIITIATIIVFQGLDTPFIILDLLWYLLPLQIVLVGFCVIVIRGRIAWSEIGFGPIRSAALLWLMPSVLLMAMMLQEIAPHFTWQVARDVGLAGFGLLVLVPILIGFSEEVMFRGILLRGAMARLSTPSAMVLSALLFGLMHAISGLVVQAFWPTLHHVALTFCVGLFLAPLALKLGSLWPLIIWHAVWNLIVFLSEIVAVEHPLALPGILIQLVCCVPIWTEMIRKQRNAG